MAASRKSLDDERNEAVRAVVSAHVKERFDGNQTDAARAYGVKQPTLNDFLNRRSGAGVALLVGFARAAGVSLDSMLGLAPASGDAMPNRTRVMLSPEYTSASELVREAFASMEIDGEEGSVVAWSWELAKLVEMDRRGWLVRERPKLMLVDKTEQHADNRAIPLRDPKS